MRYLTLLSALIVSLNLFSADRYWIAGAASNWNNTANWSTTSGGAGGASVPGAADVAIFDGNGAGNCTVDIAVTLGGITVNGYAAIIDLNGNVFSVTSGNSTLTSGTINDTPGTSAFTIASTGTSTFNGTTFGAQVSCSTGRLFLSGSTFNNISSFTKTGANNDNSAGGNTFNMDATIALTGTGHILTANTNPDTYNANATVNNSGTNIIYFSDNSAGNTVAGNLNITNSGTATGIRVARQNGSDINVTGNVTINATGSVNHAIYFAQNGDAIVGGTFDYTNTSTSLSSNFYLANGTNSTVTIANTTTITNSGTGADNHRCYLGNNGDVTFNGALDIINNSIANNSQVYCNQAANSVNAYNGNITVQSTAAGCDGVYFGQGTGSGTLAAGLTITVGVGGFVDGTLYFRNFTQTGATAQALTLTGTARITLYDASWGGDVDFIAPRITTRGTTYSGTADLEKNGAGNDGSAGGNNFVGNTTLTNSGTGEFNMGNGSPDTFGNDLDMTNSGTSNMRLAYVSAGNTVGGNLTVLNTGSGNAIVICSDATSTLAVTGNVTLTDNSNDADHDFYLGNNGDVTVGGDLDINNLSPGDRCDILVAAGTSSLVTITGTTTVLNNGTGAVHSRVYLGNNGDVIFNGNLNLTNSSGAPGNDIYLHNNANSNNSYNENIVVVADNAASDGIRFGQNGGSGTLAATKTITIGGGGFISGDLRLQNFTQVGATAQTLSCTGTARIYCYDSNWGGDVDFDAPRMLTRGTTYNGTADLEKTGGVGDDQSVGGNTFVGDATIRNTGSNHFMMGNGTADDYQSNLNVINTGTDEIYIAHNSAGNTIGGDLTITQGGSGDRIEFSNNTNSTLTVTGTTTVTNTSNSTTNQIILGNNGDIDFDSSVDIDNSGTGTDSYVYVANGTNSTVTVDGTFTFDQNATCTNNSRSYFGNNGDITFNDVLTVNNNSTAANSEIYFNHDDNSANAYNHNIIVTETVAAGDGIRFGQGNGSGTLAATRTVTIGVGGFVSGDLRFRNFTQVGPTAQALTCTGTARIYNYDSNWGGDVDFVAPRMVTDGTTYNLTASLEKSGGVGDDASVGGNTFVGNATLTNSGSNYFLMGNGSPDDFQSNLDVINNGSDEIYLAHNSAGNTVSGTLNITMSNTADRVELCDNTNSTLTVTGATTINNTSTSVTTVIMLGENGDIDFDNSVTINNNSGGTTSRVTMASGTNSAVSVDGAFTFNHNSTATNDTRAYIGNNGDCTFNGVVTLANGTGAPNSHMYLNLNPNSTNLYNNDIIVSCTDANSDGIRFGESAGFGTLAATRTVTIGVGGFIAGDLRFRNFTQLGPTAQALTCTGTARIYNYDSDWGGDVDFIAPRMLTRGTTYNLTSYLEKTSVSNDASVGGNTFVGDCDLVHTGSNQFLMGNGTADTWQSNLTVTTTGDGYMYIAYAGAGHSIAGTLDWIHGGSTIDDYLASQAGSTLDVTGDATFTNTSNASGEIYVGNNGTVTFDGTVVGTNTPSGAITGQIRFSNGNTGFVTFNDDVTLTNNGTATTHYIYFGTNGDIDLNGNLSVTNSGTGTNSYYYSANGTNSTVTINGNTDYTQTGNITRTRAYIGNQGDNTFNGTLDIVNQSTSNNSEVYLNHDDNSTNVYNGNITVTSETASTDGVRFGEANGVGSLSNTYTVVAGGGGFIAGDLLFRNFTQVGGTAQNVVLTGTARIRNYDAEWNGNVVMTAPRFHTRGTTYNGTADLTKNGASNDDSNGDNVFNQDVTVTNAGTARMRFSVTNGMPDDYNANATFVKSGSGALQPSYNNTDTYSGDISINANAAIYFGAAGNGRVLMDGGAGDQDIIDLAASPTPLFRDFQVNKAAGEVNLQIPIEITVELDLDQGVVNTSTTNLMFMRDNSTVSSVSDLSHIDGPIEKIGNDAFTFPVGDSSLYRPISISAPANGGARFRAEYINDDPHPTYNHLSLDVTLDHISSCEYWTLDRIATTNNVTVTLSWDTPTSCGVDNLPELRVARWDGAVWQDEGNGGTTGSPVSGTVVSGAAVTNFSPFTLASTTTNNPLPIELISFTATLQNEVVELNWETASETENDYFEIERSRDGQNWEYLTTVDGAGTSIVPLSYTTFDDKPYGGENYYRLKQVDFNGQFEYVGIDVVDVPFNNAGDLSIFPNPSTGVFTVTGDANELDQIAVFNAIGQQIQVSVNLVDDQAVLDLTNHENGVYYIRTEYSVNRIVKQ